MTGFLRASVEQRSWSRLLAWQGLTEPDEAPAEPDPSFEAMVADIRRRQADGEIAADLDPRYVLLVMFSAALAPTVIPQIVLAHHRPGRRLPRVPRRLRRPAPADHRASGLSRTVKLPD